jgi:large subunit ribosomal protein L10
MNPDKKIIAAQLAERMGNSPYMLLVDYTGMTMPQFVEIRKRLRALNSTFHVSKNSYIKAISSEKNFPADIEKDLNGQTAVVFGDSDVCAAAAVVKGFAKEFQKPALKSGVLEGTLLSGEEVGALADVGSKSNLLAKLLGVLNAPAGALARVINAHVEAQGGGEAKSE